MSLLSLTETPWEPLSSILTISPTNVNSPIIVEIVELNIPTAIPLVYEFDENMKVLKHSYLADP